VLAAAGVKPIILPKSGLTEFTAHYHLERNHQGKGNQLLTPPAEQKGRKIHCRFLAAIARYERIKNPLTRLPSNTCVQITRARPDRPTRL
jgi:hypothetical protein